MAAASAGLGRTRGEGCEGSSEVVGAEPPVAPLKRLAGDAEVAEANAVREGNCETTAHGGYVGPSFDVVSRNIERPLQLVVHESVTRDLDDGIAAFGVFHIDDYEVVHREARPSALGAHDERVFVPLDVGTVLVDRLDPYLAVLGLGQQLGRGGCQVGAGGCARCEDGGHRVRGGLALVENVGGDGIGRQPPCLELFRSLDALVRGEAHAEFEVLSCVVATESGVGEVRRAHVSERPVHEVGLRVQVSVGTNLYAGVQEGAESFESQHFAGDGGGVEPREKAPGHLGLVRGAGGQRLRDAVGHEWAAQEDPVRGAADGGEQVVPERGKRTWGNGTAHRPKVPQHVWSMGRDGPIRETLTGTVREELTLGRPSVGASPLDQPGLGTRLASPQAEKGHGGGVACARSAAEREIVVAHGAVDDDSGTFVGSPRLGRPRGNRWPGGTQMPPVQMAAAIVSPAELSAAPTPSYGSHGRSRSDRRGTVALEVVQGQSRNRVVADRLATVLGQTVDEGVLYLGYPVLATADDRVDIDALLVTREHGLVALLLSDDLPQAPEDWDEVIAQQDRLYAVLEGYLSRYEGLRAGRRLAVTPNTATVFADTPTSRPDPGGEGFYGILSELDGWLRSLDGINENVEHNVHAALQRVTTIKPRKKRVRVAQTDSRGAKIKSIEKGIANLDRWQKQAAIESPDGPQRIRGLAGSGKTVVLALKAAYWHTTHPEWRIAITFHSRALYQQIDDLVTRFTFEHINDRPDPERMQILHSWGSRARTGVYSQIARALGETPRDWSYASGKYGMDDAFRGVCGELLTIAQNETVEPIFDAVLIDEAQDLPPEFFQLIYLFTRDPKRIVWGYDELQRLSEAAMPSTQELFGSTPTGAPRVSLDTAPGSPRRDIVLPVCYRNTPWALATAHALGIGVYRKDGLLQHPDEARLWKDIGYEVVHGDLVPGAPVTLKRSSESYPSYFPELLDPDDSVQVHEFVDEAAQDTWVANEIAKNLTVDELEPDDILVVLPDTYRAKSRGPRLMRHLRRLEIPSHLAGVNTSADEIFQPGSVAIAHIFRAKGNEAPMVYVLDAHYAASNFNAVSRRNTLFTAITRSRAWVRILGWGDQMAPVKNEVEQTIAKNFQLEFQIPTAVQLDNLRHIHRDRPEHEAETVRRATQGVEAFLEAIDRGEMDLLDLPPSVRTRLSRLQTDAGDPDADDIS
jgi:superfamily I DNA and RNA helicase